MEEFKAKGPLVSCIIIYLNEEEFLAESIESVLAQTYNNWELILVNDGSSDRSEPIAAKYRDYCPDKIRLVCHANNTNRGMSTSRNLGIQNSDGELIAFLDGDDVWLPNKLDEQVELMEQTPDVAMLYGRTLLWNSWIEKGNPVDYFANLGPGKDKAHAKSSLVSRLLKQETQTPTTCNAIMRKSAIVFVDGFQDEFKTLYEDQAFFLKIMTHYPVFISSKTWAKYRQRSKSTFNSTQHTELDRKKRNELLKFYRKYLGENQISIPKDVQITLFIESLKSSNRIFWKAGIFWGKATTKAMQVAWRIRTKVSRLLKLT